MTVAEVETVPEYKNFGRSLKDLKVGRLLTLTGEGSVFRYDTGEPVKPKTSIILREISHIRPARRAVVDGIPVNGDGSPRKNGTPRQWIVSEGSFIVWW